LFLSAFYNRQNFFNLKEVLEKGKDIANESSKSFKRKYNPEQLN
jgi:hypothetical protein